MNEVKQQQVEYARTAVEVNNVVRQEKRRVNLLRIGKVIAGIGLIGNTLTAMKHGMHVDLYDDGAVLISASAIYVLNSYQQGAEVRAETATDELSSMLSPVESEQPLQHSEDQQRATPTDTSLAYIPEIHGER